VRASAEYLGESGMWCGPQPVTRGEHRCEMITQLSEVIEGAKQGVWPSPGTWRNSTGEHGMEGRGNRHYNLR
jgi:hypothetical protein